MLTKVIEKVKEGLAGVEDQPTSSEKYSGLDKGPATYGVVKQLRDNDMELHTDRQVRDIIKIYFKCIQINKLVFVV